MTFGAKLWTWQAEWTARGLVAGSKSQRRPISSWRTRALPLITEGRSTWRASVNRKEKSKRTFSWEESNPTHSSCPQEDCLGSTPWPRLSWDLSSPSIGKGRSSYSMRTTTQESSRVITTGGLCCHPAGRSLEPRLKAPTNLICHKSIFFLFLFFCISFIYRINILIKRFNFF